MANSENSHKKDDLFDSPDFNKKLIDSLPGIFYLYQVTGEGVFLKRWNKNTAIQMGYTDKELRNINGSVFYTKKEFERVKKAIEEIFVKGWKDIHTTLITKTGEKIPYYLQGYAMYIDGEPYFMGVGIDTSEREDLKKKLTRAEKQQLKEKIKKEKKEMELARAKRELVSTALQISSTAGVINASLKAIDKLIEKYTDEIVCDDLRGIKKTMESQIKKQDNWELFKLRFQEVHPDFFERLKKKHPDLTKSELRFCAYLRIRLSSTQIAHALNISKEGVRKTRYRIRKKVGLPLKNSLESYITEF